MTMSEDASRPLTNDEVIEQLTQRGIRATACPSCGRVKEVRDDRVAIHYLPAPHPSGTICEGSDTDLLGDVEHTFERLVGPIADQMPQTCEDYGEMAAQEAVERMTFLLEAVETQGEVVGPSGEPFCGCVPCIVRETLLTVWPYACHAQFTDTIDFLTDQADLESLPVPVRKAAQVLAEKIIERHEEQQT